ncbi:tRNA (guanosine(46)-N7)-methyltransferase TrmB [Nocardia brasiliensis]|uniref:tRNA (guanosine(46)-N7)-methyltransferase TrmB n=2 Tax=Nocardia brasiliensis TaxID=37326 RepID=UPI0018945F20|nr:tRNA (guanosine(46)-N7)-methyltransferase TrmB [Nocardia brasiliensis]MBF6127965.1 tRNA (guanosine(46)-N7)-methyltransferase TrmB [Nocardia brasiliensis]MBF6546702.1 tRNA (guanosine(46)-N7)-methyltransferase TrmB [Nocardia brasiliensis]
MDAVNDAANHTAESVPGPPSTGSAPTEPTHPVGSAVGRPADRGPRSTTGSRLYPRVTSFRSRRGALTATQQQSWDRMWPTIGREVADEPLDAAAWFGREAPLVIEIGCGTGTATAAMAQAEPHLNLIGIEVYQPGLAQLVQRIEREQIPNIRLLRGDAVDVLENMVADESLTGVRVFFPDPWPKARHHKRRLLQPATFTLIANKLKSGGVLHVATDHAGYAEHIAEVGAQEAQLRGLNESTGGVSADHRDSAPIGFERPVTKFEGKAHRAGSAITELIWGKIE